MRKTTTEIAQKIATDKVDVNISVPSMRKANNICWRLQRILETSFDGKNSITTYRIGKRILLHSEHKNKVFDFRYDKDSRRMTITFHKDGKEEKN